MMVFVSCDVKGVRGPKSRDEGDVDAELQFWVWTRPVWAAAGHQMEGYLSGEEKEKCRPKYVPLPSPSLSQVDIQFSEMLDPAIKTRAKRAIELFLTPRSDSITRGRTEFFP